MPQGSIVVRQQADQRRLARTVGADDGGVFALGDGERQRIENAAIAFDDSGSAKL